MKTSRLEVMRSERAQEACSARLAVWMLEGVTRECLNLEVSHLLQSYASRGPIPSTPPTSLPDAARSSAHIHRRLSPQNRRVAWNLVMLFKVQTRGRAQGYRNVERHPRTTPVVDTQCAGSVTHPAGEAIKSLLLSS